jgi:hypothetical protein
LSSFRLLDVSSGHWPLPMLPSLLPNPRSFSAIHH